MADRRSFSAQGEDGSRRLGSISVLGSQLARSRNELATREFSGGRENEGKKEGWSQVVPGQQQSSILPPRCRLRSFNLPLWVIPRPIGMDQQASARKIYRIGRLIFEN